VNEFWNAGIFCPEGTAEISQLQSGWFRAGKMMCPEGTPESVGAFSAVLSGRVLFLDG
jgi:hypothetical protein